jgi:hypothetical protein
MIVRLKCILRRNLMVVIVNWWMDGEYRCLTNDQLSVSLVLVMDYLNPFNLLWLTMGNRTDATGRALKPFRCTWFHHSASFWLGLLPVHLISPLRQFLVRASVDRFSFPCTVFVNCKCLFFLFTMLLHFSIDLLLLITPWYLLVLLVVSNFYIEFLRKILSVDVQQVCW